MIKLVVGLGNIGKEYENTIHNMGFMVIDRVAKDLSLKFSIKECNSEVAKTYINGETIIFAKPTTYMNNSGIAVKGLKKKYNLKNDEILVISDDIDLSVGSIRIRESGSAGTHNGLKSIIRELGDGDFKRVRVGVGRPPEFVDLADFVLSRVHKSKELELGLEKGKNAVLDFLKDDSIQLIMGRYN